MSLAGSGFVQGARAFFGSTALSTMISSSTMATATVPSALVASAGSAQVLLVNPAPGGGASSPITFSIVAAVADAGPPSACADAGPQPTGLTTLATGTRPLNIVLDACNVYWTDQVTGGVMSVPKNGGPVSIIAPNSPPPNQMMESEGLAIDTNNIYWSEFVWTGAVDGGVPIGTGDVKQTSLVGNVTTTIWSGTSSPSAVAVDPTYVYVLQQSDLERVPIGGGSPVVLSTMGGLYGLTVTPTAVLWTAYISDLVLTVPLAGGTTTTFAAQSTMFGAVPGAPHSTAVVQDGTNAYWADINSGGTLGTVHLAPLSGGMETILYSGAGEPIALAVDSANVYVALGQAGSVLMISKAGGSATTLATNQGWPTGIAVDDAFVYWVNNTGGANSVMRIGK